MKNDKMKNQYRVNEQIREKSIVKLRESGYSKLLIKYLG